MILTAIASPPRPGAGGIATGLCWGVNCPESPTGNAGFTGSREKVHNSGGLENGGLGPGGCQVNLTRMGGIGVAVAASLATIAAGLAPAAARAPAPGSRAALAVRYYTGVRGVARLVPRHTRVPGHTPAHGAPARLIEKGARLLPSGAFSAAEAVPRAPASAAAAAATATPLANFNGVSSRDSQVTNYNQETEPPDQGLCEGHGFVLEVVNSAYRVYKTTGTTVIGPFHMNDLFNVGGKAYTSDPRCWFDPATQTWFATVLFINNGGLGTKSALLIAVRHSPNPLGLWNEYSINTTDIANGCPCVGDQPRIGVDQYNLYVTDDEVSIKGQQGRGAEVWAFDKDELIAGATTLHFVRFPYLNTLAPQPALSTGTPNAEYFLSSLDFNGQGDHRIGVWAMTGRNHVGQGGIGMPVLTSTIISTESYAPPAARPAKGQPPAPDQPRRRPDAAGVIRRRHSLGRADHGGAARRRQRGPGRRRLVPGKAHARRARDHRRVDRPPGLHRRPRPVPDLPGGAAGPGRERGGRLHRDQPRHVPGRGLRHVASRRRQLRAAGPGRGGERAVPPGRALG